MPPGQKRFVLTWGKSPTDLDMHVIAPKDVVRGHTKARDLGHEPDPDDGGGRVNWMNRGSKSKEPFAVLENDVTAGFGPETTRLFKVIKGVYYLFVQCYSCYSEESYKEFAQS